ncbi:hypothetical protein MMC07_007115 [Pseudocyphellaria aurata]|nr:hypothetical protein [Pseudocyphellaria aurata]
MDWRPRLYITTAFIAGVVLTLGFKDVYPDLERRFRHYRRLRRQRNQQARNSTILGAGLDDNSGTYSDDGEEDDGHPIGLEDHTRKDDTKGRRHLPEAVVPDGIEACVGNTPLFRIKSLSEETGCEIWAKAEAEEQGLLRPHSGDTIYEGTVGSTGISLATMCRARGYLAHICMPSDQAMEKSDLLLKLGAVVERVPPAPIVDPMHFVNRARSLAAAHTADPNRRGRGFFADQFENEANWRAHYERTGPEIYQQCGRKIDAFVAGAGTGGTIAGVARFLKPCVPDIRIVLADPQGSGLFNRIKYGIMFDPTEREGTRRRQQVDTIVEGIGINRVTLNFEAGRELVDDAIKVDDNQALAMARWLVEKDGIFVGSSSAVNCELEFFYESITSIILPNQGVAAVKTAQQMKPGSKIVTILCDSGTRHMSKFWAKVGDIGGKTDTRLQDVLG